MSKPNKKGFQDADLENKVQVTDQQIDDKDPKALASSDTEIKEIEEPKSSINTRKAAEVVAAGTTSMGGGALGSRASATTFSGGAGNTRGDESATTRENASYKSRDRSGRRADPITRKIDFTDAEIIVNKIYQSKPLAETSEKQGYTGNYYDEHAIAQKCSGGAPADPMLERSNDELAFDMLYYALGQVNSSKQNGDSLTVHGWNGEDQAYTDIVNVKLGNYVLKSLDVTFDADGDIVNFVPNVDEATAQGIDERCSRAAADTVRRFFNLSELDRNAMITTAGDESKLDYSALGDQIIDSTDQNRLIRLLDAIAGDYVGVSVRKCGTALSYQINKTAKDGSRRTGPMAEMFNGCIDTASHVDYGATTSVSEAAGINAAFYNSEVLLAGGAGLWLAANDSLAKYNTKGKVLSLPLGPKSALNVAKANMDPLICDKQLFDLLNKNELFSTIDGPYDPLKPIVVTDKVGIVYPINPFVGCEFDTDEYVFNSKVYTMNYSELRKNYVVNINNYFAQGIFEWFSVNGHKIVNHLKSVFRDEGQPWNSGTKTLHVPVVSSTTSLSLWDLIVCQSVPYMIEKRLTTMTPLLKYEKNHGYPYSGVSALKDIDVNGAENYSFTDPESPLVANVAKPIAAMKVIMPEMFWPVAKIDAEGNAKHNGVGAKVVLPHYFVQNQFVYDQVSDRDHWKLMLSDDYATMAYPSTRSGANLAYMDTVYGMSEEDYRLSLDRMVVYPSYEGMYLPNGDKIARYRSVLPGDHEKLPCTTYKYGLTTDGIPVVPYLAYANSSDHKLEALTLKDIITTPRELGLFQVAPAGYLSPIRVSGNQNNMVDIDSAYLGLSGPGFRMKIYHTINLTPENTILGQGTMNITNNASLQNVYDVISCNRYGARFDNGTVFNASEGRQRLIPFVSGSYDPDGVTYDYDTGTYSSHEEQVENMRIYTNQKYFWNRIQRMPFVLNPFDCNVDNLTTSSGTLAPINDEDIYDYMYFFGFCGFKASDYSPLIEQRVQLRIAKGMNYISDPFIEKTLLLK